MWRKFSSGVFFTFSIVTFDCYINAHYLQNCLLVQFTLLFTFLLLQPLPLEMYSFVDIFQITRLLLRLMRYNHLGVKLVGAHARVSVCMREHRCVHAISQGECICPHFQ